MEENKLYSPKVLKGVIEKHGFRFSKGLGQNFLIDGNVVRNICNAADINENDEVIEIGPGVGTLSQELCQRAKKVLAIELDDRLIPILKDTLSEHDNFSIINSDVLKLDLHKVIKENFEGDSVKLAANLPYYITTPIIMKILESHLKIKKIAVMVQKEVAMRIQAKPGTKDYGALSIAVGYYSKAEIALNVPRNVFMPKPNVDSAVVVLDIYGKPRVDVEDEVLFFKVVKSAFAKRRKTLLNALSSGFISLNKEQVKNVLERCNIDPKLRGEVLSIEDYAKITNTIVKNRL
ncbi:16S rRNA (adenine(1518)-N(6)/adenine(1519)-N(6))-dimethyltransferase RsmA [Abyssisolibacter fermentans]|uniref:16S rRNA (adenine(1518)-N(6)/adenine(1519)-N(6))- dimethyltransferase RsmA n=1 Tax=Abyssisolibacter fermentans TaxID=1766203 RepID=UPI00082991D4|nr:16S rRNA (adenine(1518)-N(6)/adenine(1519)-N(6))-dimethyltransferase RsmA [Abyssisolibacter fermentans]